MIINDLLKQNNMSMYRLSKESGVPMTTVSDICSEKTDLAKCAAGTLCKIAKVFDVSVEYLLERNVEISRDYVWPFEAFKSNTCHRVKDIGDIEFIIETIESDEIRRLFRLKHYRESLYLLAMVDYLSRVNKLPLCSDYDDIREHKLEKVEFPSSVVAYYVATKDEKVKENAIANAIPEFMNFNIVESEIRNVY